MRETYGILENILKLINEDLGLEFLCRAIKAYDTKNLPIPLETTYFTVSCEENKCSYFEDETTQQCMKNTVTIRLNCFAPLRRIPYMSHGICEIAVKFISDSYMPYVKSSRVGETQYDSEVKAFRVPCTIVLEYLSCPGEGSQNTELNEASQYFCKTHIADSAAHLSENDRKYLQPPLVTGTYTGDGAEDGKTITLGFRPAFVMVFRNSRVASYYRESDGFSTSHLAIAAGSTNTRGISITSTGFNISNITTNDIATQVNVKGDKYTYIAFR